MGWDSGGQLIKKKQKRVDMRTDTAKQKHRNCDIHTNSLDYLLAPAKQAYFMRIETAVLRIVFECWHNGIFISSEKSIECNNIYFPMKFQFSFD